MARIFYIYWFFHAVLFSMQFDIFPMPHGFGRYIGFMKIINLGFISVYPFLWTLKATKAVRLDAVYAPACLASSISSIVLMAIGVLGMQEIHHILFIDVCSIGVFFAIKRRLENFSNSKWLSMYDNN